MIDVEPTSPDRFSVNETGLLELVTTTTCVRFHGIPSRYGEKEYLTDDHIVTVEGNRSFMVNPKSLNGSSYLQAGTASGFLVRFFGNEKSLGDCYWRCFTLGVWLSFDEQGYLVIGGTNQRVAIRN